MRKLPDAVRAKIIHCLVENNSVRGASRLMDVSKDAVLKLLVDVGEACAKYLDESMRNLDCQRIECDEIWTFVHQVVSSILSSSTTKFKRLR